MAQNFGVPIIAPIVTPDSEDTFPTHIANMGKGGVHSVASTVERDAISADRRVAGMLCYVVGGAMYRLGDDLVTWALFTAGAGDPYGGVTTLTYGTVSSLAVFTVAAGQALTSVEAEITEVWDGSAPVVTIGTNATAYDNLVADLPLTELALVDVACHVPGPATVYATVNPGSGASSGQLRLRFFTISATG